MDALENQLKEARFLAEEADKKYDEVLLRITQPWFCFCLICFFVTLLNTKTLKKSDNIMNESMTMFAVLHIKQAKWIFADVAA